MTAAELYDAFSSWSSQRLEEPRQQVQLRFGDRTSRIGRRRVAAGKSALKLLAASIHQALQALRITSPKLLEQALGEIGGGERRREIAVHAAFSSWLADSLAEGAPQ